MARLFTNLLGVLMLFTSGCATVGKTTLSHRSPCISQSHSVNVIDHYSPTPKIERSQDSLPVLDLEEELPPAPPQSLDTSSINAKPIRKPVLPPLKKTTVSLSRSISAKIKS